MATIIAVRLNQRIENAEKFQNILSKYGCNIKTRIGIHDVANSICSPDGVILLDGIGEQEIINNFIVELNAIKELKVKSIEI